MTEHTYDDHISDGDIKDEVARLTEVLLCNCLNTAGSFLALVPIFVYQVAPDEPVKAFVNETEIVV